MSQSFRRLTKAETSALAYLNSSGGGAFIAGVVLLFRDQCGAGAVSLAFSLVFFCVAFHSARSRDAGVLSLIGGLMSSIIALLKNRAK